MPSTPQMIPPVGKSGPLMNFINSGMVMSGLSICAQMPSMTSPRLWGGHVGGHADGDAGAAVDEQIWKRGGKTVGSVMRSS